MTKAVLCVHCYDILAPFRDWQTSRAWRWCQCDHAGVRWADGAKGLVEVTAVHGPDYVRVIGLNNAFLDLAVHARYTEGGWRKMHELTCAEVAANYLFHADNRNCWALVVRPGESGDVTYVDWMAAKYPRLAEAG